MKQTFLIVFAVIFVIICITCITLINIRTEKTEIKKENIEYEKYIDKEISGTELATVIGKAIDCNKRNNIQKDDKGYYIDNGENCIKIDLKMVTINKTYPMEEIYNKEITNFVQNFNSISFKCTSIEYHKKTGKVSKLVFEELQ